jgi:hypothetical protein
MLPRFAQKAGWGDEPSKEFFSVLDLEGAMCLLVRLRERCACQWDCGRTKRSVSSRLEGHVASDGKRVHVTCPRCCCVRLFLISPSTIVQRAARGGHYGELPALQSGPTLITYALESSFEIFFPCKARRHPHPHSSVQPQCRTAYRRVQHRSFDSPSLPEHL